MFFSFLSLIISMLSVQMGAGFAKTLFPTAGAAGTSALRLFFATLVLWILWRPWRFSWGKKQLFPLLLYGLSLGAMNLTFYFALQHIPLGLAVTLEFIGPLSLSLMTSRKKIDILWVVFAALGILLVLPSQDFNSALDLTGVIFALVAGFFWALYIYFGQKAGKGLHGGVATAVGMMVAALFVLPFGIALDGPKLLNVSLLPLAFAVAVLSSAIPYSLEMVALKKMPTKTFGILMSLEPVVALAVGFLMLSESLAQKQYAGVVLIMMASLGSVLTVSKKSN